MKYYRVKPEYDGKQLYKRGHKSGVKIPNGYSLIARELLTEKEAEKLNVPQMCVDPVNVKKSQVYICFGARFEMEPKMYGFRVYRKINVAINGVYVYSTNAFRTCKEAIAALREKQSVTVAGIPDYTVTVKPEDKITAHFAKR